MTNELAVRNDVIQSLDDIQRMAKMFLATGYFDTKKSDASGVAELATKILAGRELGFKPFASVQGIYVVKGKPSVSGNLMASAVKRSSRYDYRIRQMDNAGCKIEFFEVIDGKRESVGFSEFTAEDAKRAGTQNMNAYPRNMMFNRAMSNGVKWYCPDVFDGVPVYTPEELGAEVDANGDYIESTGRVVATTEVDLVEDDDDDDDSEDEPVQDFVPLSAKTLRQLNAAGSELYGKNNWEEARHRGAKWASGGRTQSSRELTEEEAQKMIAEINRKIARNAEEAAQEEAELEAEAVPL